MSVLVLDMVWKARGIDSTSKLVPARLAGFANEGDGSVYPSVGRIASDCGLTDRCVRMTITKLVSSGVLTLVAHENPAIKRAREYRINTTALTPEPNSPLPRNHVPP